MVAIIYMIRLICKYLSTHRSGRAPKDNVGSRKETDESKNGEASSYTENISNREKSNRCLPSKENLLDLVITRKKREFHRNQDVVTVQTIEPPPKYSKVVLQQNTLYVGGLHEDTGVSYLYLTKLDTPEKQKTSRPNVLPSSRFDWKRGRWASNKRMVSVSTASTDEHFKADDNFVFNQMLTSRTQSDSIMNDDDLRTPLPTPKHSMLYTNPLTDVSQHSSSL